MLERANELHEIVDVIAAADKDLRSWALTGPEWEEIGRLIKFLKV